MAPVIAIDGPNASGKGTVARHLATRLGWQLLDSGALYRLVALDAEGRGIELENESALVAAAAALDVEFLPGSTDEPVRVRLAGEDVTRALRTEACGARASRVAVHPAVREALLARQRAFRRPPGLVADGRDMGTVVFSDAELKIFLTASAAVRARRRHNQLRQKGIDVSLADLSVEIEQRDRRDREREAAPLMAAADAIEIDTTALAIDVVLERVLALARSRGLVGAGLD